MTLVFLFEQPAESAEAPDCPGLLAEFEALLCQCPPEPAAGIPCPPLHLAPDVIIAGYRPANGPTPAGAGELLFLNVGAFADPRPAPPLFSSPAAAFVAVADWLMRHADVLSSVLAIHATRGLGAGSAEIEQAAGILKTAIDLCGTPGWLCNLWLKEPGCLGEADNSLVKSLWRMSSPVGDAGSEEPGAGRDTQRPSPPQAAWFLPAPLLPTQAKEVTKGAPRCFAAAPALAGSPIARLTQSWVASIKSAEEAAGIAGLEVRAFLVPKDGERIADCQDALAIHKSGRRLAISDGAGTASYSAEWARALCRRAVLCPPRFPSAAAAWEDAAGRAPALRTWLDGAVTDWAPEVPWERLRRPAMFNKAQAGSGATLAGIEFLGPTESGGLRFQGWALGDSCVIHARGETLVSSRPVARAADFGYEPKLLMTRPGFEEKYALAWQDWQAVLEAGDWLMLATDAMSEYMLLQFEMGAAAELLCLFVELLARPGAEGWRTFGDFVQARRARGDLRNDDVGLALVRWRK